MNEAKPNISSMGDGASGDAPYSVDALVELEPPVQTSPILRGIPEFVEAIKAQDDDTYRLTLTPDEYCKLSWSATDDDPEWFEEFCQAITDYFGTFVNLAVVVKASAS